MSSSEYRYTVLYEPAEEGGFIVRVPALPGLFTEGDTIVEAREMAADAIRCYIEGLRQEGRPIPVEELDQPIKEIVAVELDAA